MRVLLDECVDRRFARHIAAGGHEIRTVAQMKWAGIQNGELLTRATGAFDVFLTVDRNIEHQQNLSRFNIALVVLHVKSNAIEDLVPMTDRVLDALPSAAKGEVTVVE